jgi:hypothetical protein
MTALTVRRSSLCVHCLRGLLRTRQRRRRLYSGAGNRDFGEIVIAE